MRRSSWMAAAVIVVAVCGCSSGGDGGTPSTSGVAGDVAAVIAGLPADRRAAFCDGFDTDQVIADVMALDPSYTESDVAAGLLAGCSTP